MALPTLVIPDPVVTGDTFESFQIVLKENSTPINLTGASIRIHFKLRNKNTLQLSNGNGITITNPTQGTFVIDTINRLDLEPGLHLGDLEITFANNVRTTYCRIKLNVLADITI